MTLSDRLAHNSEDRLEEALAKLATGVSLEETLAHAGNDAEWLQPLLALAVEVGELRPAISIPSPEASLRRLLTYREDIAASTSPTTSMQPGWLSVISNLLSGGVRLATGLATVLLVLILMGGTVSLMAQHSLPGESLYRAKRVGETLHLSLTRDPARRQRLMETYNQRRQLETRLLLEQGKQATITFEGTVESLAGQAITVDGLMARVTDETQVTGELAVRARVRLEAETQPPDGLIALAITVIEPAPPTATLTPTATPTATLRPTTTNTPISVPAVIDTPRPTPTPTATQMPATPTATSTPTAKPESLPTATSTVVVTEPPPPDTPDDNTDDTFNANDSHDNFNDNVDDGNSNDEDGHFDGGADNAGNEDNNIDNGGDGIDNNDNADNGDENSDYGNENVGDQNNNDNDLNNNGDGN